MSNKIHFKRAQPSDIAFLLELRKLSMDEHLANAGLNMSDQQHKERVLEFFDDSFLICCNEQSIGLIKFAVLSQRMHIRQFQILPEFHNRGIGSQVLDLLKTKAQQRGLAISLNVLHKNPALKLYCRHGFVILGENELEYQMRWQGK